jgi:antibiotic biosynthesis monooxygenase (ABM) superfamily enzyme
MTAAGTGAGTEPQVRTPATVVIAQRVCSGREGEFRQWQDDVNRTAASFAGFLGSEVLPPADGQEEWTVVYRFESTSMLEAWLESPERRSLLERGSELFDDPASQKIIVAQPAQTGVAVVVSHPVSPENEEEFLAWQERMTDAERAYPGFLGSEVFRPVPGIQEDWTIVYRFDTSEHLDRWLDSSERQQLLAEGDKFGGFDLHRISNPFGSWFSFGDDAPGADQPPSWKTALSVLVGLYPTVGLLTLAISELWPSGELWESLLLGNVLSVGLLTWLVMPIVTRGLRFWLAPTPGSASRRVDVLGAGVSIAFLTAAAAVFWLVTTVIWTLP